MGSSGKATLADMFHIGGIGCDVTLSASGITWKSMGDAVKIMFRKKNNDHSGGYLSLDEVLGASVLHLKREVECENEKGPCLGLAIYTHSRVRAVRYEVEIVEFTHPSQMICEKWRCEIQRLLTCIHPERPRNILLFIDSKNGEKSANWSAYKRTVEPLFSVTCIHHDVIENVDTVEEALKDIDLSKYDSVVCIGSDAAVNKVTSGLLDRSQGGNLNGSPVDLTDISPDSFNPHPSSIPLGIIPTGPVDQIVYSVLGTDDVTTAAVHIILGNKVSVDVCSVWCNSSFIRWSFISYFGFFASVLSNMLTTSILGDEQKIQAGVVWTLKRKQCRTFDCEFHYVPSADVTDEALPCRFECSTCKSTLNNAVPVGGPSGRAHDSYEYRNHQALRDATVESETVDSTSRDINDDSTRYIGGQFASVIVTTLPGLCKLAPLGVSKFTHLSDGCLDLVLFEGDSRKEFVRYLKRLGSHKNQLDLPGVKAFRCKQVQFRLRDPSAKLLEQLSICSDDSLASEANASSSTSRHVSASVIEHHHDVTIDTVQHSSAAAAAACVASGDDNDDSGGATPKEQTCVCDAHAKNSGGEQHSSWFHPFRNFISSKTSASYLKITSLLKSKEKTDRHTTCLWSMDSELHCNVDLRFKAHSGLLVLHGTGIPIDYHPANIKMPCLSAFK